MDDNFPTQRASRDDGDAPTVRTPKKEVVFSRYELQNELGKGGMGVVWLALDRELNSKVALKFLREEMTSEADALKELKGEVIINRDLSHPNIIKTFSFETNGRTSAISMEYVNGVNLHRLKKASESEAKKLGVPAPNPAGFFEVEDIRQWVWQLCDAMDYAHRQKVVHRDIKPANLMLNERGELKVGDFGIGRTVADTVNRVTKNAAGTPPYMSPQQTMGEKAVPADDLDSIGATIFDLLTGDPPFFRGAIRDQTLMKMPPGDETVAKLRPLLAAGIIREKEFGWLQAALAGGKGEEENALALRLMEQKTLTPEEWRKQTELYPRPKDPFLEKVKPLMAAGVVGPAEGKWLREALAGEKDAGEKTLAERLVGEKSLTPGQWRARTMFSYALPEDAVPDPAQLPAAIDLPLSGSLSMRLLRIDPGTFVHGAPREELGRRTNELPPERVAIEKPFYLAVQGGELPGDLADPDQQRRFAVQPGGIQAGAAFPDRRPGRLSRPGGRGRTPGRLARAGRQTGGRVGDPRDTRPGGMASQVAAGAGGGTASSSSESISTTRAMESSLSPSASSTSLTPLAPRPVSRISLTRVRTL